MREFKELAIPTVYLYVTLGAVILMEAVVLHSVYRLGGLRRGGWRREAGANVFVDRGVGDLVNRRLCGPTARFSNQTRRPGEIELQS